VPFKVALQQELGGHDVEALLSLGPGRTASAESAAGFT
jgi:hypothetical protein